MALGEIAADHTVAFDEVVRDLEREQALEEAERDAEAQGVGEFGSLHFPVETGEPVD